MDKIKGNLYLILSASAFGIMPILAKLVYRQGMNTNSLLFYRFLFASIMLSVYIIKNKISIKVNKQQLKIIILITLCGYSLTSLSIFTSYNYISVGLATMIIYIHPSIVVILSAIIYKEKIYKLKVFSLIISFIGIIFLVYSKNLGFNTKGVLFALAAAIFYSFYVIGTSSKCLSHINSYVLSFYVSIICVIVFFIMGKSTNTLILQINFYSFICILILAFISTMIALMAFIEGVKIAGPSNAAIFSTLEPIISLLLGGIILKENISMNIIAGSIFIVISLIIISKDDIKTLKDRM